MRFPHNFHPTPRHFHPRFPVNDGQYPQGPRGFLRPPGHHFHASPGPPRHIIRPQGSMPPQQQQPPYGGPPSHCRGPSPGIHSGQPLRARGAGARGGGAPPNRYHHRQNYNNQPMHMNGPRFPNGDPFHGGHDGIQRCQRFEGPNRTHNQQHPFPKSQVQKKQNGKQKKTKEPKEVDYSHYCDVCDGGFKSEEQFQAHVAEHVQVCNSVLG
ncbi:uncharacterized protein [Diadema setosum]|uniref:uncharacterized protein n=1 Tax=Diadema setosum TaxID=31175 RepID=UPI003B3A520C